MDIDPASAAGTSEYEGVTYYFCSRGCKLDFDEDPAGVVKAEAEYDHSQPMEHGMMMAGAPAAKKPWWKFWG
jgi:Cu+-exporting ATPase